MKALAYLLIGLLSGVISGMGIGGGTLLIPALTMIYGIEQQQAQNVNLIYFIPTAVMALVFHIKSGNVEKKVVKGLVLFGIAGAVTGSVIAVNLSPDILRKLFGGFLGIMGLYEFFKKNKN
ncbi:MAG: sulfite exporter TauE/SafE family protein [Clostridiales bacterium]|jgi:uncharacterized membrane protein YfcA|nr:sulfite exporter TauE/SafE family protein [Clostridiales bacterium]